MWGYSFAGDRAVGTRLSTRRSRLAALCAVVTAWVACAPAAGAPAAAGTAVRTPPTSTPAAAAEHPGRVLDLTNWKLQLPVSASGSTAGRPLEISQPALGT